MLARYKIYMHQARPDDDPLPDGVRIDIRKHRNHVLSPTINIVQVYLKDPTLRAWGFYVLTYNLLLIRRYKSHRQEFDELAQLATDEDVYLGCNCPTIKNPDVHRCHTVVALRFMETTYRELKVRFPERVRS